MIKLQMLTEKGIERFRDWLATHTPGKEPPVELLNDPHLVEPFNEHSLDESAKFGTRAEFGHYLVKQLGTEDFEMLLNPECDGLWAWITVVYFSQLGSKKKRDEHYIVTRKGSKGSLAYRHGARTCYELTAIHGSAAHLLLGKPMHTFGDLTEQFASRQTVVRNKSFIRLAERLYLQNGKVKRGANSRPKRPKDRPPGDTKGLGSVGRLGVALRRLDLTWDTESMEPAELVTVLPKEFSRYANKTK